MVQIFIYGAYKEAIETVFTGGYNITQSDSVC